MLYRGWRSQEENSLNNILKYDINFIYLTNLIIFVVIIMRQPSLEDYLEKSMHAKKTGMKITVAGKRVKTLIDEVICFIGSESKRFGEIKRYLENLHGRSYAKGTVQKILDRASNYIEKTSRGIYQLSEEGRQRWLALQEKIIIAEKITLPQLERFLWKAADILRGAVEAPDYKHYVLPLLFFKRLSDVYLEEHEELLKRYGEKIARELHTIKIPDGCFWDDVRKVGKNVGAKLNDVLDRIAKANPELEGVINRTDFNAPDRLPPGRLFKMIEHFSTIKLGNRNVEPDVLGRVYEYLIRQFALLEARKGGEFYTPREVVRTLVKILDPHEGDEVYDPCCGSGGMLVYSHYHLKEKGEDPKRLFLHGQELSVFIWSIAKMNIILHDMEADIRHGDTFADPKFLEPDGSLKKFDIVIANPMWNQDGYRDAMETDKFRRFTYGIAPNNSADWGWIQHMLASLKPNGRMGVVLDRGSLFRGGSEGKIRRKVVEDDLVECIVHLPEKIFYNTGAPGCLLILNKNKAEERKGKVLFVYAEENYGKHDELKRMNKLRDDDIEKVVNAYREFKDIPKYAKVASIDEIRENDYNLSVTRYVDVFEEEEQIDVPKVLHELKHLDSERLRVEEKLKGYLEELGHEM